MADHLRTQIKDAAIAALGGLTTTGTSVFKGKVHRLEADDLPALLVYMGAEESEADTAVRPRGMDRVFELIVEGHAQAIAAADLEDTLDTIAAEVETALGNNTLAGLARDLFLISTEADTTGDGDKPAGMITMTWRARYRTREGAPTVAA